MKVWRWDSHCELPKLLLIGDNPPLGFPNLRPDMAGETEGILRRTIGAEREVKKKHVTAQICSTEYEPLTLYEVTAVSMSKPTSPGGSN